MIIQLVRAAETDHHVTPNSELAEFGLLLEHSDPNNFVKPSLQYPVNFTFNLEYNQIIFMEICYALYFSSEIFNKMIQNRVLFLLINSHKCIAFSVKYKLVHLKKKKKTVAIKVTCKVVEFNN